jgi:hypothetical protein
MARMGDDSLVEVDDRRCLDCHAIVTFPGLPSHAICPTCGLRMYLAGEGIGRYPGPDSTMGGIQGHKPAPDLARRWHPARGPRDPP